MPKHKHADLIIAWANGAEIEYKSPQSGEWTSLDNVYWNSVGEYRIKPDRVWPVTSLTNHELQDIWESVPAAFDNWDDARAVANAAIKRYIEDNEK